VEGIADLGHDRLAADLDGFTTRHSGLLRCADRLVVHLAKGDAVIA
jgi:hypothetical protein